MLFGYACHNTTLSFYQFCGDYAGYDAHPVHLAFVAERWLPEEIAWRPKTDLQFGSGMCALESPLALRVPSGKTISDSPCEVSLDAHENIAARSGRLRSPVCATSFRTSRPRLRVRRRPT